MGEIYSTFWQDIFRLNKTRNTQFDIKKYDKKI